MSIQPSKTSTHLCPILTCDACLEPIKNGEGIVTTDPNYGDGYTFLCWGCDASAGENRPSEWEPITAFFANLIRNSGIDLDRGTEIANALHNITNHEGNNVI